MKLERRARNTGWGIADQGLSSLTNFALGVMIARSVDPESFGAFGITFGTYLVALGVSRALTSELLLVRYSGADAVRWRAGAESATGAALALGIVMGFLCFLVSIVADSALEQAFTGLALGLPGLLVQDSWRYAFFAQSKGTQAFVNDFVWSGVLFPLIAVLIWTDSRSIALFMLAWGTAATFAAVVGAFQAGVMPRPLRILSWLRSEWELAPRFLAEFALTVTAIQLVLYALAVFGGLQFVAALRGAQILLGPFNVLLIGVGLAAIPAGVKLIEKSEARFRRASILLSAALASSAFLWGLVAYALPSDLGRELLGRTWQSARELLLPVALTTAAYGASAGAEVGLRSLAQARRSLRVRTLNAGLVVAAGGGGAFMFGSAGAAWGLTVAFWITTVLWWKELVAGLEDYPVASPAAPSEQRLPNPADVDREPTIHPAANASSARDRAGQSRV